MSSRRPPDPTTTGSPPPDPADAPQDGRDDPPGDSAADALAKLHAALDVVTRALAALARRG